MDYIKALEEERKKILVFERELPLSLQLVTLAIETCMKKEEVENNCDEITSECPILEEFMPLRPSYSSSDEENRHKESENGCNIKPDWLKSVQLWNQKPEIAYKRDGVLKPIAVNVAKVGGAFRPFEKDKHTVAMSPAPASAPACSTTCENDNNNGGDGSGGSHSHEEKEKEGNSQRKQRRCWSPELHRRFVNALQQLGGSHVATPKQIRDLMKVDGLTNDEVKSHLQKYRLHTRRPSIPAIQNSNHNTPQQPQIVLVGGLWVQPPVYAPIASLSSELSSQQISQQSNKTINNRSEETDNRKEDAERTNSNSSTTSSSPQ